ncbi:MAG: hypothetical protein K0S28_2257, partial [Paucimonas sp.]|nr:hypothetical protein [Paucimonas sp.]
GPQCLGSDVALDEIRCLPRQDIEKPELPP